MTGLGESFVREPSRNSSDCAWRPRLAAIVLAAFAQTGSELALGQEVSLPPVEVQATPERERADGPVDGYHPTRSSTFTKTDTPLIEVPASITVVPAQL